MQKNHGATQTVCKIVFCRATIGYKMQINLAEIERKLQYEFQDKSLLRQAFVHSSFANLENIADNERMEFFGDAVLECVTSEYVYFHYPQCSAGQLSKLRAMVVSRDGLSPVVDELGILDSLLVAEGSRKISKESQKLKGNLYEAVLCAIYLDGGMEAAKCFVLRTLKSSLDSAMEKIKTDYKTIVQEYCQERKWSVSYKQESRSGPDNTPTFVCSLWVDGKKVSSGKGFSKKNAEQDAASKYCKSLEN